jgi:HSP20 family protein
MKRSGNFPNLRSMLSELWDADRFFDNDPFFKGLAQVPSVNVKETENQYEVELAAPGLDKKDFRIETTDNLMTISAERQGEKSEEKENYTRREFNYSSFSRSFQLPPAANADACQARYENGILKLAIPKKEEAIKKPRKEIEIS